MEKYSAYRDPGTGIQPFLTPVPPLGSESLTKLLLPIRYVIGTVRTGLVLLLLLLYLVVVRGVCLVLSPIPPIYRVVTRLATLAIARAALFTIGLIWIPVEQVTRKRGRGTKGNELWNAKAGDVIVSNWVSWIEVLWLAFRFDPIFVVPIAEVFTPDTPLRSSTPVTHTPGRRTGTGSANIQAQNTRSSSVQVPILGFRRISLLSIIQLTGQVPPYDSSAVGSHSSPGQSLEDIRKSADRPVVVFPECTTSNGRGLLRFADVFHQAIPVTQYQVFVMCVRYDPPTTLTPTLTQSIPYTSLNPIPHLFNLSSSLTPLTISIRLLAPSESPSSQLFIASEVVSGKPGEDQLAEACAFLIAQIGKMKRTGMGWEDKASFLEFYRGKRKS